MSRFSLMTWGVLLILIGVELNLVNSVVLTPRATKFLKNKMSYSPFENEGSGASNGSFSFANGSNDQSYSNQGNERRGLFGTTYQNVGFGISGDSPTGLAIQKKITPPSWYCWPPMFLGAVLFLFGAVRKE